MKRINRTIRRGTGFSPPVGNWIRCRDGFTFSAIAHWGAYCTPRPAYCFNRDIARSARPCGQCQPDGFLEQVSCGYHGPYTAVEIGFPSLRPEPWSDWEQYCDGGDDPTQTVYGYVPIEMVKRLIIKHGGEQIHTPQRTKRKRRVTLRFANGEETDL